MDNVARQKEIETKANDFSYDRLMKEVNKRISQGQADELTEGRYILLHSIETLSKKIDEYFKADIRGVSKAIRDMVSIEFEGDTKELAFIILVTIVRSISKEVHISSTILVRHLTNALYSSILIRRLYRGDTNFGAYVDKRFKNRSESFRTQEKLKLIKNQDTLKNSTLSKETTYLGAYLLDLVIKSGINIIEAKTIYTKGKSAKFFVYTEECFRMVLGSRDRLLSEYRKYPILITPPVDWTSFEGSGGYHTPEIYKLSIIKTRDSNRGFLRQYFEKADVQQVYDTLNVLQGTAWKVNRKVYEVLDKVFQDNVLDDDAPYNNPYLIGRLPYNAQLEAEDFVNAADYGEVVTEGKYKGLPSEKMQMHEYFRDLEEQRDITISNTGKAIMFNLVIFNAKEYLDEEEIYFSYQYDFRGRIYPIQQHLQPQGKGEAKALLQFKDGVAITTSEELFWFLVHGANCYGFDKEEYEVRVEKIQAMTEDVVAIADNPLKHRRLWKDTDEPYLYLAWCFEYAEYLASPDTFLSHIPIALDATCSGIQIYSGLLLDKEGAEAVNVVGQVRNDIYQRVADKVNQYLYDNDYPTLLNYKIGTGEVHEQHTQAVGDSLKGKITRKLTKSNTMTQPYSVTKYGMYEQLKAELVNMEKNNKKFWVGDMWITAKILTDLNDRAIAETVKGARIGQEFLKEVTSEAVKKGRWVFYTAPITKFPILQRIHRTKVERVQTPIGKLSIRTETNILNPQKMVNGIAPNFIHGLDAALLSSTVLKLKADGCTNFHLIHDSYGVPINQVSNLNLRVREAYVELFKQQPLQQWIKQVNPDFEERGNDIMINTLDLEEVMDSRYIFS